MNIDIKVYCITCEEELENPEGGEHEMLGDDLYYINKDTGHRTRGFFCGCCKHKVNVELKVKNENKR